MIALGGKILLETLAPATRDWLAGIGRRQSYADGELIHAHGDREPTMCVVIAGQVRMSRLQTDGTQTFVGLIDTGQHFGDVLMFDNFPRTHDTHAVGAVTIDHYDRDAFELALGQAEVVRALYAITARRVSAVMSMNDDLRWLPREVHLAKILLHLRRVADGGPITCLQEELAALLGTSVVTLSKAMALLKKEGLIKTGYRTVSVTDAGRLREWIKQRVA
jgi:CRP-like cAMP-binding protein